MGLADKEITSAERRNTQPVGDPKGWQQPCPNADALAAGGSSRESPFPAKPPTHSGALASRPHSDLSQSRSTSFQRVAGIRAGPIAAGSPRAWLGSDKMALRPAPRAQTPQRIAPATARARLGCQERPFLVRAQGFLGTSAAPDTPAGAPVTWGSSLPVAPFGSGAGGGGRELSGHHKGAGLTSPPPQGLPCPEGPPVGLRGVLHFHDPWPLHRGCPGGGSGDVAHWALGWDLPNSLLTGGTHLPCDPPRLLGLLSPPPAHNSARSLPWSAAC